MSIGFFTDKLNPPGQEDIRSILGDSLSAWDEMLTTIRDSYRPQEDFKFLYGKNYGWAVRFRLKGKLLTSLYPAEGHFRVQVILSLGEVETVQNRGMGPSILQAIDEATPYPEGRWLFIRASNRTEIPDILNLLELHSRAKQPG